MVPVYDIVFLPRNVVPRMEFWVHFILTEHLSVVTFRCALASLSSSSFVFGLEYRMT